MAEQSTAPVAPSAAHVRGLLLVFVAGVLYASAGVFTRGVHFDVWTMLAWRSLAGAGFMVLLVAVESRRVSLRDYRMDLAHLILVPIGAAATICYIFALKLTTVADVMIVYATTPFMTAIVAWVWIREVPSRRMLIASSIALVGVGVMIGGAGQSEDRLLGVALMVCMNLGFALALVLARRSPGQSMTPVNAVALLLAALVSFVLAPRETVDGSALLILLLFGIVTVGFAMSLFMAGARLAPSSEVALIGISDVVLGPLMVWLIFGEDPGIAAMAGGAIVTAALVWNIWPEIRRMIDRRRAGSTRVLVDRSPGAAP